MRRSFEELALLFDYLNQDYDLSSDSQDEFAISALIHLKAAAFLENRLYGNCKNCPDIVINEYADVLYDGYGVEYELEYITECKLCCGQLPNYVLSYFLKSPHWEVSISSLYVGWDEDFLDGEGDEELRVGEKYVREHYGDFFDEEFYNTKESLGKLTEYYYVGADFTDDLCIIKSSLYPYCSKFIVVGEKEHPKEIDYLKKAFKVIGSWLNGADDSFQTKEYGYFLSSDGSDESYGFSYGCLCYNRAMVIAAELVEEIMFALDTEYHILPSQILREEELRWTQGQGGNLRP